MRRARLSAAVAASLAFAFGALAGPKDADPAEITPVEAQVAMVARGAILIDVRTPGEWARTGLAEGAARVSLQDPDFIEKVVAITGGDSDAEVAFICRSGRRSLAAAEKLMEAGYTNVSSVAGGMMADQGWQAAGLPMVAESDCGEAVTATC